MSVWYRAQPVWWAPLERDARRHFGDALRHTYHRDSPAYDLAGLDVIGEPDPLDVRIRFYKEPPYLTYGQRPEDFPRVHAKPGVPSKHRHSFDDALCLWYPLDPEERRWTSSKGLLDLIEIVRTHLFLEHYWRLTGGESGGQWLVEDARTASQVSDVCRPSRRQATDSGWTWAQTAALIVPCIALLGAFLTYALSQRVVRREHRAKTFAEALTAVEEYLEMPYRIRCRPDSSSAVRQQLTDEVSSLLARMAFHQAWLQIEATTVAGPYASLVATARAEAGAQMSLAGQQPLITSDSGMNLGLPYPRDRSNAARATCIEVMRRHL
ncbi:hypothetical protein ACRJ4W_23030 [Streptomyces sp. GLT-R25]